ELDEVPPQFEVEAGAAESPDAAADLVRSRIGFDAATRRGWQSEYAALRAWRRAIEDLGALVFQISGVDVEETRGFSCYYHPLPVIAVNSADAPVARVFTLAHELGHLMRRSGATCDLRDGGDEEVWCNRFAGELLVPRDELTTLVPRARAEWTDSELQRIARAFWVSSEVALRRLVAIERATPEFYEQWRARRIVRKPTTAGGPVPIPKRLLSSAGTTFVRLVLSAFHADRISASTMASYLGVKLKHLSAIEQLVVAEAS
ncbi:MAG: ImmA/IrrE family metallo-endopeptidase, partial [Planctomycetota bacterium]